MVFFFIESTETLSVDQDDRCLLVWVIWRIENFLEEPQSFRAWINRWTDLEAVFTDVCTACPSLDLLEEQLVEQIRLSSSILSDDGYDSDVLLDAHQEVDSLLIDLASKILSPYDDGIQGNPVGTLQVRLY